MFHHPIPGLDHPNVLSYIDVLRRDAKVRNMVSIIGVGMIEFGTKRCMGYWGVDGTKKARVRATDAVTYQRRRG